MEVDYVYHKLMKRTGHFFTNNEHFRVVQLNHQNIGCMKCAKNEKKFLYKNCFLILFFIIKSK